jgi:hypothetical protein
MTSNPRPNTLPAEPSEFWKTTRPLVVDHYLTREGVIRRIAETADVGIDPSDGHISHTELARLFCSRTGRNPDAAARLRAAFPKYVLIQKAAKRYGFDAGSRQDSLIKSQLVHILLVEATGDQPAEFTLPSDPGRQDRDDDVAPEVYA